MTNTKHEKGYYEETQDEMAEKFVTELSLPQGRILYPTPTFPNCVVESVEDGPFWYGDLTQSDMAVIQNTFPDKVLKFNL